MCALRAPGVRMPISICLNMEAEEYSSPRPWSLAASAKSPPARWCRG